MRIVVIHANDCKGTCELCGVVDDLRPYGPNGEKICFDCGMKNSPATARQFQKILTGENDGQKGSTAGDRRPAAR
jgi:hypothetical protein